ncbi:MAG: tetratricopeptide repeat protein [Candidatus Cloacimonetes bacterium]|nr:tetratricopeptide repeat protein [Candidatus Cloacimonadota bacterium]
MKLAIALLLSVLFALTCLPLAGQNSDGALEAVLEEEYYAFDRINAEIERLGLLAVRRTEVKQAYESGNLASVQRMFLVDSEPLLDFLDNMEYSPALGELIDLILVYQNVPQLGDQLLLYEGVIYKGYGRLATAQSRFEELLAEYPGSQYSNDAVIMLEEIYFLLDENEALVSLAAQYPDNMRPKQVFWLANAHFNLDNMEEAEALFNSLLSDPNYGFKAEALLALTSYYNFGLEYAIEKFLILVLDYPEESLNFDFVYLSLGRLYQERGDFEKALYCYNYFMDITQQQFTDEFYYELVLLNLQMEDYETALSFLGELLNDPYETSYYNSPNYLSAIINYGQGNITDAKGDINLALDDTSLMVNVLDAKRELIRRHKDLMNQYNQSSTRNAREEVRTRLLDLNEQIYVSTGTLENVAVGLSPDDVIRLQIYEEEFALVNDTIEQVRLLIDLANSRPNTKVPEQIDQRVEELDGYIVEIGTLQYLSSLDQLKMGDYELAYALANEIGKTRLLVDKWQRFSDSPGTSPDVRSRAQRAIGLMQGNLQSLETVALYAFGEQRTETEFQQKLAQELQILQDFRTRMLMVREQAVRDYNRQIAKRLGSVNLLLLDENQGLREQYVEVLASLEQNVQDVSARFEYTLLDILYDETLQMDEQFQQLQAEYRDQSSPQVQPEITEPEPDDQPDTTEPEPNDQPEEIERSEGEIPADNAGE